MTAYMGSTLRIISIIEKIILNIKYAKIDGTMMLRVHKNQRHSSTTVLREKHCDPEFDLSIWCLEKPLFT